MIAFVTGKFVDRLVDLRHRDRRRPWPRPHRRIVDRELIEQCLVVGAGEALDHVGVGARVRGSLSRA